MKINKKLFQLMIAQDITDDTDDMLCMANVRVYPNRRTIEEYKNQIDEAETIEDIFKCTDKFFGKKVLTWLKKEIKKGE